MTGYGQGSAERPGLRVTVELRTLNNRFLDLRVKVPSELAAVEARVRRVLLSRLRRGRVEAAVRADFEGASGARATFDRALAEEVLAAAQSLRNDLGVEGALDLHTVISIPGLFKPASLSSGWDERDAELVDGALARALDALESDRVREGEALQAEMAARVRTMQDLARELREAAQALPGAVRERLSERLRALAPGVELDPQRVAQEAVLAAERSDVTEELVRLEGHLEQIAALLAGSGGEPVGKRLDFLLQEIHRETNTVNGKSADLGLSRTALELKLEAEKVREQIQNVE
ncbi:MAG TPA: YicC/YloC family endoribonuclease [Candidatus Polarisedimenticolaceae bacterium]|nr:YicC/YloC family endoribonuclease [Candidatus Polarisedimenticolaceae bacterium]